MSVNPDSGLTGHGSNTHPDQVQEQQGVIPTVLSYVGLSPSSSRDAASGNATNEPAFGAAVGPKSHSTTGHSTGLGSSHTTGHSTGLGSSNLSGGSTGLGSSNLSGGSDRDGYVPAPTLNPHDEERAKVVAARATGSAIGGPDGGLKSDSGFGSSDGYRDGRVGDASSGLGSTGAGVGSGVGLGSSGLGSGHHGSGVGSGVGLGSDRTTGTSGSLDGVGSHGSHADPLGNSHGDLARSDAQHSHGGLSGREHGSLSGRDSLATGSLAGNTRAGETPSDFNETRRGSGEGREKLSRAAAGESEGATAEESQKSVEHHQGTQVGTGKGKLENRNAIPTAGGVQLGEKHWGESDFVGANPKPRGEENISSSSGQPDQSTKDNTHANTGGASAPGSEEQHKEGLVDKVKDKLHMGGH